MHCYRANEYALSKRLKQSAVMFGTQVKSATEFHTVRPTAEKARGPEMLSR